MHLIHGSVTWKDWQSGAGGSTFNLRHYTKCCQYRSLHACAGLGPRSKDRWARGARDSRKKQYSVWSRLIHCVTRLSHGTRHPTLTLRSIVSPYVIKRIYAYVTTLNTSIRVFQLYVIYVHTRILFAHLNTPIYGYFFCECTYGTTILTSRIK